MVRYSKKALTQVIICESMCENLDNRTDSRQAENRDLSGHDYGFSISSIDST